MSDSTKQPKLLDQARWIMSARHYSIRAEEAYVQWMRRFILFHNKHHPKEVEAKEIDELMSSLAVERQVAASTQNQALCAILFLHKEAHHQEIGAINSLLWSRSRRSSLWS